MKNKLPVYLVRGTVHGGTEDVGIYYATDVRTDQDIRGGRQKCLDTESSTPKSVVILDFEMVLPPIQKTPILLLRFTPTADDDLIRFVKERLEQGGILVVTEERSADGDSVVFGLTTTQEALEHEAELVKLVKPTTKALLGCYIPDGNGTFRNNSIMAHFTTESRGDFIGYPKAYPSDVDPLTEYDSFGLFTSSDRTMLVWSILDSIHVLEVGSISSDLSLKLDQLDIPYLHYRHCAIIESFISKGIHKEEKEKASQCLRHVLQDGGLCDIVSPYHIKHIKNKILQETLKLRTGAPIRAMRDYYGEEIAFYFAWMDHFSKWMIAPGCLGLIIYIARLVRGDTVDTCDLTPFHGLGVFIWAICFLRFWDRQEARLAYEWGTFSSTGYERKFFGSRPEFEGELRASPVTGQMEKYYPPTKRRLKIVASAFLTCILLACSFCVMIMSLNLQGYVRPRDDRSRWVEDHDHPFYYPMLATFAEEGNIFDAASQWKCFLPVLLHVVVVMLMNKTYRRIAEVLTEWENHETSLAHENSIIIKRFAFEAFDAYVILFYLAFYEKNIEKLRGELVSVFNVDTFRRLLVECLIPMAIKRIGKEKETDALKKRKKSDTSTEMNHGSLFVESTRDEYEQFDDYLEMLIELGYVTLFASAYPLASFIAIFSNFVELRSDIWKLSKICLRPRSIRTDSIGTWKLLMKVVIWFSALTNCLIFCFTSQQMLQWMPDAFSIDKITGHHTFVPGKGAVVVFAMFSIERVLLVSALLILVIVPPIPEDVTNMEERRQFVREQTSLRSRATELAKSFRVNESKSFSKKK